MTTKTKKIIVPLNRVEGDLEISVDVNDGIVTDAWSSGLLYRGFENILIGRGALDGLVITPRICGICSTSHLNAAALALDMIKKTTIPQDALRIRNLALATEHLQSDMRQAFLMFATDFQNPVYKNLPMFEEAVKRYEPFKGETVIQVIQQTRQILEIIAIIGGQWPHSSYMVPGGVVSLPCTDDLLQCRLLLKQYRNWYEHRILGCSLERWQTVRSNADLEAWLEERDAHRESDLGFYIRFARMIGLDKIGRGHGNYIGFGSFDLSNDPSKKIDKNPDNRDRLIPSGFAKGTEIFKLDQTKISEHIAYSWFIDDQDDRHPFEGKTRPYASGVESKKYSWAKAPRYNNLPAETGPLADMIISKDPLFIDLIDQNGPSAFTRELARIVRAVKWIPAMEAWISTISADGNFYESSDEIVDGEGFGLVNAARGALGHWVRIEDGQISHYQIIPPTTWNGSPRDSNGVRGPWEEALIGTKIADITNPVELGHVVRSFDPCLVCTVHALSDGKRIGRKLLGI